MGKQQQIYVMVLLVSSLLIINLLISDIYMRPNFVSLTTGGSIFNIEIKESWMKLLYLDEVHAQLLLKKGLPLVRVESDKSLSKPQSINKVVNLTSELLFDLPPSFFKAGSTTRTVITDKSREQNKVNNNIKIEQKMKAEGRHQGEKVELDFWQTESSVSSAHIKIGRENNTKAKNTFNNLPGTGGFENRVPKNKNKLIGIYHTHTAENYENRGYNAHAEAGAKGDIIKVGAWIKERLANKYNITALHSLNVHDETYDRSYIRSLHTAKQLATNNPELDMLFDIHRDAIGKANKEVITTKINGQKVAKIMIVVTNNNYGLPHPNWRQNVAFAKKLATKMNRMYPGLLRKVKFISNRRYNQHVHPQAVLLEVGGASSTLEEAKRASYLFADVLAELMEE
ncbi:MAG: stage II sporulation protein P [Bacillota bacterium]